MTRERWLDFVAMAKDKFTITAQGKGPRDEGEPGGIEFMEFESPIGPVRCEYEWHPKIIGKRAIGGHKVGVGARVKYDYDPHEETAQLYVFKKVGGEWQEIDASMFAGNA